MERLLRNDLWEDFVILYKSHPCIVPILFPSFFCWSFNENEIVTCAPLSSYLTYRFIAWKVVLDESSSRETIYDEWMNIIIIASKKLEHWAKVVNWICRVQRVSYTNERFQCYAKRWMRLLRMSCCEFTLLF